MDIEDLVLDATYRAHGRAAVYQPPSGPSIEGITICFHDMAASRNSPGIHLGGLGLAEHARSLLVRRAEVAAPEAGGEFILAIGARLRVGEVIDHDPEGREWRCAYESAT